MWIWGRNYSKDQNWPSKIQTNTFESGIKFNNVYLWGKYKNTCTEKRGRDDKSNCDGYWYRYEWVEIGQSQEVCLLNDGSAGVLGHRCRNKYWVEAVKQAS